jgi:hypothetical protein
MGVMTLPAATSTVDNTPDLDAVTEDLNESEDGKIHTIDFKTSERYEKRIIGVFEDTLRLGYI